MLSCNTLTAARGADLSLTYLWPTGTNLGGYSAQFTIYGSVGGSALATIGTTPNANGSYIAIAGNIMFVLIKAADIATIPVASPVTASAVAYYDFMNTALGGVVAKLSGGSFIVKPVGSDVSVEPQQYIVDSDGVAQSIYIGSGALYGLDLTQLVGRTALFNLMRADGLFNGFLGI